MKTKTLTVRRETAEIFTVMSSFPYWADGSALEVRVAFDGSGKLSAIRAQAIDSMNGNRYVLVTPVSVVNGSVLAAARTLCVGESQTVEIA
jgi:hypothetical protein